MGCEELKETTTISHKGRKTAETVEGQEVQLDLEEAEETKNPQKHKFIMEEVCRIEGNGVEKWRTLRK